METSSELFHRRETLALVARYATPLAIILVSTGLLFAPLEAGPLRLCLSLFIFTLVLNFGFHPLAARLGDKTREVLAKARAGLNLWINIFLVYLMGSAWPAIWLILMLTAVATAIYGTRERTLVTAGFLSVVLAVITLLLGNTTAADWGNVLVKAAFILLVSLMVNDLARVRAKP